MRSTVVPGGSHALLGGLRGGGARATLGCALQQGTILPIDMLLPRFFEEVDRLYPAARPFARAGREDPVVARIALPPYRAVFGACLLFQHAAGYRLPDFATFAGVFCRAFKQRMDTGKDRPDLRERLFEDPDRCARPSPGFLHRLGGFYVDGMTHAHLYATLVQAYEDQRRIGAVLWDGRVDWKLKTDLVVLTASRAARIDIHGGSDEVLARRAGQERETKADADASSHEGNPFHGKAGIIRARSHPPHVEERHGLRFLSGAHMDDVIAGVDAALGVPPELAIRYRSMVGVGMGALKRMRAEGRIPTFDGGGQGGEGG